MKFEFFMVMKIWVAKPCNNVVGYKHFGGSHSEDGGTKSLKNVNILHHYMA
jgi:hypothetical protein